jgi:hypothetical protein
MSERAITREPCGPPIEIEANPDDTIVLDDASGEVIDVVSTPASGRVWFDAPDCSNSVTVVARYYSSRTAHALTVTNVAPGSRIDLAIDRSGDQVPQERIPFSVSYSAFDDTSYARFSAPACLIDSNGEGSCATPPTLVYGITSRYGTGEPLGYALVPAVMDSTHYERTTATVNTWRTDFAAMEFDMVAQPADTVSSVNIYMHSRGETYAMATPAAIPRAGDAYTVMSGAYRDQTDLARYRRDLIIDPFGTIPSHYTADFSSVAAVESVSLSDIKTFTWEARGNFADVTRVCAQWGGSGLAQWCVLTPSYVRSIEFPCLPSAINPTEPPSLYGVSTIDTSLANDYDDVARRPFQSFDAPWSGGPDLRIRVSTFGFVQPPWWWL